MPDDRYLCLFLGAAIEHNTEKILHTDNLADIMKTVRDTTDLISEAVNKCGAPGNLSITGIKLQSSVNRGDKNELASNASEVKNILGTMENNKTTKKIDYDDEEEHTKDRWPY